MTFGMQSAREHGSVGNAARSLGQSKVGQHRTNMQAYVVLGDGSIYSYHLHVYAPYIVRMFSIPTNSRLRYPTTGSRFTSKNPTDALHLQVCTGLETEVI